MKLIDFILIALVAAAVVAATVYSVRRAKRGGGCGGNCAACRGCAWRDEKNTENAGAPPRTPPKG